MCRIDSMRYLGSKKSVVSQVGELVTAHVPSGDFGDPFGGIGIVGAHFKTLGFRVHAGDLLTCAHHFQVARLVLDAPPLPARAAAEIGAHSVDDLFAYLNSLRPVRSWVYREFALRRPYFTRDNAGAIDAVRRELARWWHADLLTDTERAYLSACLLDAADRVANTAGTYYAHLKKWHRKSLRPFSLLPLPTAGGPLGSTAIQTDAINHVQQRFWDVLYLDPPYNTRDYAGYYHFPETLATGRRPRPYGRSGVDLAPRPTSDFACRRTAGSALRQLLDRSAFRLLVLHYSDAGLIKPDEIRAALKGRGSVREHVLTATGYSSTGQRSSQHRLYVVAA